VEILEPINLGNPQPNSETRDPNPETRTPKLGNRNPEPETRLVRPRTPPASTALKVRPLWVWELRHSAPDTAAVNLPLIGYDTGAI